MEKLSIKSNEKWSEQLPKYTHSRKIQPADIVLSLQAEAQNILDSETKLYHQLKENKRDKDFLWIKRILHSGTLSDKVSAHTLLIQDSPVYNIKSIETLIGMVNTKGKRECLMAMDALQDLFVNNMLVEDKKLSPFNEQPLKDLDLVCEGSSAIRKRFLILWMFQDTLKSLYKKFLNNLNAVSYDTIEKTKQKTITVMFNLLKENPEQEHFLLEQLVNKIGDPSPKVASHSCYVLGQLLVQHRDMKSIVVQEMERFVFRHNLAERAKYYALCFLNQVILSIDESELANQLIMIYFGQFKLFVKKGEVNTKMMSALLTGVARAYPYAKLKDNVIMEQLDAMYRLVHLVSFNISIQALMLIFQVLDSKDSLSDRFYSVLYRKLFDPALSNSSRQSSLLNLVYRALKKDVAVVRVKSFVKRLLQISLYQAPNLQCGILLLISELCKIHPNLLETEHVMEFDSDSDEHYEDLPDEDEILNQPKADFVNTNDQSKIVSSWVHRKQGRKKKRNKSAYDLDCRNPLHAGAEYVCPWELIFLKNSFHPSVSLFAHQICSFKEIKYSGDPLLDFTTAKFLDRFVYRNPKKPSENLKHSAVTKVFGGRKLKAALLDNHLPINSTEYLQQNSENIPPDEKFIFQFLQKRSSSEKGAEDASDVESVCSEDFQKLLDEMHAEDEGKDTLNFAKELGLQKQKKNSKRKADSDSENDSLLNGSDFEDKSDIDDDVSFEGEDFENEFGDLDEDMTNNVDLDLCEEDFIDKDGILNRKPLKKKRKVESLTDDNLLAAADEFSTLLEDNAGSKVDTLTGEAFQNKDKSGAKQLAWEMQRHRYVKGVKWQNKRKGKFRKSMKKLKK